ncbi:alpha/beta fold hydrolase [Fusibacter ferrireducens]|uniref:Alpha/beta hydrolase n=1 Tax=Fusibacter ferrireducens TaxID=2785058 RepID=A0ABR9ZX93_9FIRM|nr:alpha/beta hydrolase [Fusibacter ferrireducens]MBF4694576.1 alpha/beta hydrolase [Fusibacter ferrireducens]
MSFYDYKSKKVHYIQRGHGKSVLILHGWGTSIESFNRIIEDLSAHYQVTALDFPGFGLSDEPIEPFSLSQYTELVETFISHLGLKNLTVIGHSFGGRVAIKLSPKHLYDKLILVNSAGIKPKRKPNYYFKVYGFKGIRSLGKLPIFSYILAEPIRAYSEKYSSQDYKQASPMMKMVLSKVVNEDLKSYLPQIASPTLMIWGDQDTATPLQDAQLMSSLIPDAGLVVFEGAGHFTYLEQPNRFLTIIKTFIGG